MSTDLSPTKEQIIDALRQVQDPELHKDLVTLNMVKNVAVCDGLVRLNIELTTPACPLKDQIRNDIDTALKKVEGVRSAEIEFSAQVRSGQTPGQAGGPMGQAQLPNVKNIIAVGAGKGGVGKSTVSVLTAVGLARAGAKVGLMDADVYGPSIPKMLGIENAKPSVTPDEKRIIPVEAAGIKVMSIGFMIEPDRAVIWRGPMIHGTVKQFLDQVEWGELDYLIVDLPPGTGDVPLTLSQSIPMTGAVVVCTPQDVALLDAVRAAKMYQQLNVDILGIVENMSYFIAPDTGKEYDLFGKGGAEKAAAKLKAPFLGSIPINVGIRISGDKGNPHTVFEENNQGIGDAVTRTVENLAGQVSIRNSQKAAPVQLNIHR